MESNNSSKSITRHSSSSKLVNEPIIGIDLGTTNSCVSIIRNGNVEIIEDKNTGKRLIGHKFSNKYVQEDIKNWPIKIIEDKKTGKPQYVIKIGNEEKRYFPEDVSSMILKYLKNNAETHDNKKIKKG